MMLADNGTVLEETHYYPFGLIQKGVSYQNLGVAANKEKFNGIEQTDELGLNQYDAVFRTMDPQLGRFWQIDPRPSDWESPYAAMRNDPIYFSDPLGDTTINGEEYENNRNHGVLEMVTVSNARRDISTASNIISGISLAIQSSAEGILDEFRFKRMGEKLIQFIRGGVGGILYEDAKTSVEGVEELYDEWDYLNGDEKEVLMAAGGTQVALMLLTRGKGKIKINIPSKLKRIFNASKVVKKALPSIDATGKVHGTLPKVKDLGKYSKEELHILLNELKRSVQRRIEVTTKMGRDRGHGQRQGAEQDLIKSLEKYLQR